MLDIKFIRENKDLIKEAARKKKLPLDVDALIVLDEKRIHISTEAEGLRAKQNAASQEMGAVIDDTRKSALIAEMSQVKEKLGKLEDELKGVMTEWRALMLTVPNVPDISVPEGDSDAQNVEVRTWGEIRKFDFTPKNQTELLELLDLADFERGTKVAGFRGYFLKNEAVQLEFALWQFTFDRLVARYGFTPVGAPSLVRPEGFFGTGYLPQSEEDLYKTQDGDYLSGTAEVATMAYFMNEVIETDKLPIKLLSFSPCFRREAGSHGKDTKGLVRVHEFFKVEQVILCEGSHEESVRIHEEITANSEALLQELNIPYHVVANCGGDLGLGQVKKYDIECWVPSEGKYRETHSSSYFHDFQTRRLNIRYRDSEGKLRFAHSLNNTALATPRFLVPLLENNQEADGSVRIPEALRPYMGGKEFIRPR